MSGSGLLPFGETYVDRFPFWLMQVSAHPAFERAYGLLDAGVTNFEGAGLVDDNLQELRGDFKGLLEAITSSPRDSRRAACSDRPPRAL